MFTHDSHAMEFQDPLVSKSLCNPHFLDCINQIVRFVSRTFVVRVNEFLVGFNVEPSVLPKVYHAVQESQPILFHVLCCDLDVAVYCVMIYYEGFYPLGFDIDPGVIR